MKSKRIKPFRAWATLDALGDIIDVHVGWSRSAMRHMRPGVPVERVTIVRPVPRRRAKRNKQK